MIKDLQKLADKDKRKLKPFIELVLTKFSKKSGKNKRITKTDIMWLLWVFAGLVLFVVVAVILLLLYLKKLGKEFRETENYLSNKNTYHADN